jgi:hypothetical protein
MDVRRVGILVCLVLGACAGPAQELELTEVRAATMSGPAISWEELDIHPALVRRPCSVSTLVTRSGATVGYCTDGRLCRTMDWRPVEDGCRPQQLRAARN